MAGLSIVIIGLSVTSSWGNGHATTYRGLMRALDRRGHRVTFLERDAPWYADNRDLPKPPYGRTFLYGSLAELRTGFGRQIAEADLVIVGSYVPDGIEVCRWVQGQARGTTAFYDIDTPVTLQKLEAGAAEYLAPELIPGFDLYLSFTGGPILDLLERRWGARRARPLYCSVDPEVYRPVRQRRRWLLGYLGTYSPDRQPTLDALLTAPARERGDARFVVAGSQYPAGLDWPGNVERIEHLAPDRHAAFYSAQAYTLNVTRADMIAAGWSPSVRLFEAAACGTPIISDWWSGLDAFLEPGKEILIARSAKEASDLLALPEKRRHAIGAAARRQILANHTARHRAEELERYFVEVRGARPSRKTAALSDIVAVT